MRETPALGRGAAATGWRAKLGNCGGAVAQAQQRGRGAAVLRRLVDDAEQRAGASQRLAEALLVAFEGIEAAAQHEGQLILQDVAGGPQFAAEAQAAAQQTGLAVGASVAELGKVQRD